MEFNNATYNALTTWSSLPDPETKESYDPEPSVCSSFLEKQANAKIQKYQLLLKDIQVYEELLHFGKLGDFDFHFFNELDWLKQTWLDDTTEELFDAVRVSNIEDKLVALPFETAYCHVNKNYTLSLSEIWQEVFQEPAEWRMDPSIVMAMSREDKIRIHKYFEYMGYFVINTRTTLLFDIQSDLGCKSEQ